MTIHSYNYDSTYDPAAPVVEMALRLTWRKKPEVTLTALVDSGGDGTMIPKNLLRAVKARYVETRMVRGISNTRIKVKTYGITVRIGPHTIYGIRAAAIEPDGEPIIGRDVINQLVVTLNGLANVTEVAG